jgi:hypothetical protein
MGKLDLMLPFTAEPTKEEAEAYLKAVWEIIGPQLGSAYTFGLVSRTSSHEMTMHLSVIRADCLKHMELMVQAEALHKAGLHSVKFERPRHSAAQIFPTADSFRLVAEYDCFEEPWGIIGTEQPDCFEQIVGFCRCLPQGVWCKQQSFGDDHPWGDHSPEYYYEPMNEVNRWLKRSPAKSRKKTRRATRK